ncbi:hypothetical protein [Pararhizobium haloflavum]|uniref:hypothetical protein n=1 Tax=Pararhizobium haloflavum TaxID=2037914 RepID=UPI0012FFD6A4|nr:hypothetical protein [Pararhizobium haloflavum]
MQTGQLDAVDLTGLAQTDDQFFNLVECHIVTGKARHIIRPIVQLSTDDTYFVLQGKIANNLLSAVMPDFLGYLSHA